MSEQENACICEKHRTACPSFYLPWHEWAEKANKTHKQIVCPVCCKYVFWIKRLGRLNSHQERILAQVIIGQDPLKVPSNLSGATGERLTRAALSILEHHGYITESRKLCEGVLLK